MLKNVFRKKDKSGDRLTKASSHDQEFASSDNLVKVKRSKTSGDLHELKRSHKKKKRGKSLKVDTAISIYQVGDYVNLSTGQKGFIRYIGTVDFARGQWYALISPFLSTQTDCPYI